MSTIAVTINLPTGSRNPQEYHNAVHEAIAAATARGDSMGAHALAGLLALMVPLSSGGGWAQGGPVNMDAWRNAGPQIGETVLPLTTPQMQKHAGLRFETVAERCPRCGGRMPFGDCFCDISQQFSCADPTKPA